MKRKRIKYIVVAEDYDVVSSVIWERLENVPYRVIKPTLKSAERTAQKRANITGHPFLFYVYDKNVRKTRIVKRCFICYPQENETFLNLL